MKLSLITLVALVLLSITTISSVETVGFNETEQIQVVLLSKNWTHPNQQKGAHREVTTRLYFQLSSDEVRKSLQEKLATRKKAKCWLGFAENITKDVFVDVYEMKSKHHSNPSNYPLLFVVNASFIDIELPSFAVSEHTAVYTLKTDCSLLWTSKDIAFNIIYHSRYQAPQSQSYYSQATINMPFAAFLKYESTPDGDHNDDEKSNELSKVILSNSDNTLGWNKLVFNNNVSKSSSGGNDNVLAFSVPIGQSSDLGLVLVLTFVVTIFGFIILSYMIWKSSPTSSTLLIKTD